MIDEISFEEKHIREIQQTSKRDPILIERTIYAFGLLEALTRAGLPFIFKGGTSLMLLLEEPRRLSTDIDIVVEPNIDIDKYIGLAGKIFPFKYQTENIRKGKNGIVKRHFKFAYDSPINRKPFYILLDVIFEHNHYLETIEKDIMMNMLISKGKPIKVKVPSPDCILADKLTAFAPYTVGIPLRENKDMEVIKQMYDITSLMEKISNYEYLFKTYKEICEDEIRYRGKDITYRNCLLDTFKAATCIAGKGKIDADDYKVYLSGIKDIRGHIFSENFSAEIAATRAPKIMYLTMCMLTGNKYVALDDSSKYINMNIRNDYLKPLKYMRVLDSIGYSYIIKADMLYTTFIQNI